MNTHAHHHHHDHSRTFLIGIAINSVFVVAEIFYGLMANSLALLADAGHNASDVLGLIMAWGAGALARRPASGRFTYGFQSASIFAALANGLLLMVAVGGIGWEALQRFSAPETPAAETMMVVAAVGVVINGVTAWLLHAGSQHDLNIRGAFLHMAADAAISLGVVISGAIILQTGWLWIDPSVSLLIVIAIAFGTWGLLKEATTLALHAVPKNVDSSAVRQWLAGLEGVKEIHDLHIWAMSTTSIAMSVHLIMPSGHPGDAFIREVTHDLEERFRITHATLQIELGDDSMCHVGCEHA